MNLQWRGLILTAAMAFMAPAQATFMVDDFNTTNTYSCRDDLGGSTCPLATTIDDGNTVWNDSISPHTGITRTIEADLTNAGDGGQGVDIEICSNCQAAHTNSDPASVGEYSFVWTGPSVDLSGYTSFMFDWGADLAGATWYADFGDSTGTVNSAVQSALPATPGPGSLNHLASLDLSSISGVDFTDITQLSLHFDGVGSLDGNIDNVRVTGAAAVPEPGVLALLSVGLLGLGFTRRKMKA